MAPNDQTQQARITALHTRIEAHQSTHPPLQIWNDEPSGDESLRRLNEANPAVAKRFIDRVEQMVDQYIDEHNEFVRQRVDFECALRESLPARADDNQANIDREALQNELDEAYFEYQEHTPEYQVDVQFYTPFEELMGHIRTHHTPEQLHDLACQNPVLQLAMGMV